MYLLQNEGPHTGNFLSTYQLFIDYKVKNKEILIFLIHLTLTLLITFIQRIYILTSMEELETVMEELQAPMEELEAVTWADKLDIPIMHGGAGHINMYGGVDNHYMHGGTGQHRMYEGATNTNIEDLKATW